MKNLHPVRTLLPIASPVVASIVISLGLFFGLWGALSLELETDITALLPQDEADESFRELARTAGLMRKVVILVGPVETEDQLHLAVDAIGSAVGAVEGCVDVFYRVDGSGVKLAAERIVERAARLHPSADGVSLAPQAITDKLEDLKRRLAAPEAMVMQQFLLQDPLGWGRSALKGLEATGQAMGARVDKGHLLSGDGRFGLVLMEIGFDPFDIELSSKFVRDLDSVASRGLALERLGEIRFRALGGVHFASSSSGVIIQDIQRAFLLTSVGILFVFFLVFRRLRYLPAALLPGGLGIAAGVGFMAIIGEPVHALTLGFAATVTGISVDYAIHLLHRATLNEGERREGSTTKALMVNALGYVATPIALGCGTTVAAFVIIASSNFIGIRQLALFASISVPVSMGATLLLLPPFHHFLLSGRGHEGVVGAGLRRWLFALNDRLMSSNERYLAAVFCILVFGALAVAATGVEISGDPESLGYDDPELSARMQQLEEVFPGVAGQAILVAAASDLQAALEANDDLYDALLLNEFDSKEVMSVSPFFPSSSRQRRSLAAVEEFLSKSDVAERFSNAGFKESYFKNFASQTIKSPELNAQTFAGTSLERVVRDGVLEHDEKHIVLTRVVMKGDDTLAKLEEMSEGLPLVTLISSRLDARRSLETLQSELVWMIGIWMCGALLVLAIVTRSVLFGLRAAIPAVFGVLASVALFAILGRPLTPVASAGLTLVLGLGIDYGIFIQRTDGKDFGGVATAIFASALTTIAGFGVLSVSRVRAMSDLGLIALCGISAAVLAALFCVPLISRSRTEEIS